MNSLENQDETITNSKSETASSTKRKTSREKLYAPNKKHKTPTTSPGRSPIST
jgi:hypothetical protein